MDLFDGLVRVLTIIVHVLVEVKVIVFLIRLLLWIKRGSIELEVALNWYLFLVIFRLLDLWLKLKGTKWSRFYLLCLYLV